jgi:hypothetical protein
MAPTNNDNDDTWLSSLARKATLSEIHTHELAFKKKKSKGRIDSLSVKSTSIGVTTKAERIQQREEKRKSREERKQKLKEERRDRLAKKTRSQMQQQRLTRPSNSTLSDTRRGKILKVHSETTPRRNMTTSSKCALEKISTTLASTVFLIHKQSKNSRHRPDLVNGLPPAPKGKATKHSTLHPHSSELQPRIRDYNGQGLARPSMYLPFNDAAFVPKLEEEFAEHIPGFFGKAKKGAGKRQRVEEDVMLWRRCLEEKRERNEDNGGGGKKKKSKTAGVAMF